jgi:predicted ferric reductase
MDAEWEGAGIAGEAGLAAARAEAPARVRRTALPAGARARSNRFLARVLAVLGAIGLVVSVALIAPVTSSSSLAGPGGVLTAVGRATAMSGTYLLLVTLLLIARIPAVERAVGQDRLVKLHRALGPAIIGLIGAHVVTIVAAYAAQVAAGPWHELLVLATTFPGMMLAVAGFGLLVMAAVASYRFVRRTMKYETWWAVHLYTYLAVALALPHQILTGAPFMGHPLATAWWLTLWFATAGAVIVYRWGLPVARSLKHRVTVHSVEEEAPGVVSVTMTGRHLDQLEASGGQFLHWRFLKRDLWWQAHPYSLSAVPTTNRLRITVKDLGDHSGSLARIEPGTRVAIEGPYGTFTNDARHTDRVVLVAAGVGVTPVRALLEDLPRHVDVVAILRGRSRRDLALRDELAHLVGERGGQLHELVGPRSHAKLDARGLTALVPDLAQRDLYVCGPGGFMQSVIAAARRAGVPHQRIHHEDFAFQAM